MTCSLEPLHLMMKKQWRRNCRKSSRRRCQRFLRRNLLQLSQYCQMCLLNQVARGTSVTLPPTPFFFLRYSTDSKLLYVCLEEVNTLRSTIIIACLLYRKTEHHIQVDRNFYFVFWRSEVQSVARKLASLRFAWASLVS